MVYIVHSNLALSKLHCRNSRRRYGAVLVWRAARRLARLAGGHGVAGGRADRGIADALLGSVRSQLDHPF